MKQFFKNAITSTVDWVQGMGSRVKTGVLAVCIAILSPVGAFAQSLANTGYDAGTSAMEEVATQIAAYVPYVVNLCYALAGKQTGVVLFGKSLTEFCSCFCQNGERSV